MRILNPKDEGNFRTIKVELTKMFGLPSSTSFQGVR